MAAVTQTITNYLGGVSKQTDEKKLPGQVRECINAIPDPTFGLMKRPGLKFSKTLETDSGSTSFYELDEAKWFYINRDGDEKYIGRIGAADPSWPVGVGGNIRIWNALTGVECDVYFDAPPWAPDTTYEVDDIRANFDTVTGYKGVYKCTQAGQSSVSTAPGPTGTGNSISDNQCLWDYVREGNAQSYLTASREDYHVLTVQDTTFITNKTRVIETHPVPTDYDASKGGTVHIKTVAHNTKYEVIIDGFSSRTPETERHAPGIWTPQVYVTQSGNSNPSNWNTVQTGVIQGDYLTGASILEILQRGLTCFNFQWRLPGRFEVNRLSSSLELKYFTRDFTSVQVQPSSGASLTNVTLPAAVYEVSTTNLPVDANGNDISTGADRIRYSNGIGWSNDNIEPGVYYISKGQTALLGWQSTNASTNTDAVFEIHVPESREISNDNIKVFNRGTGWNAGHPNNNPQGHTVSIDYSLLGATSTTAGSLSFTMWTNPKGMTVEMSIDNGVITSKLKTIGSGYRTGDKICFDVDLSSVGITTPCPIEHTLGEEYEIGFDLRTDDNKGNSVIKSFKDEVESIADLPYQSIAGRKVKIVNTAAAEDAYWLEFFPTDGISGDGKWEESRGPSASKGLVNSSMPHELFNPTLNQFVFKPFEWNERETGDMVTNSDPSFVGSTIQQGFFHNNRLGFLSEDNVIMSQSGDVDNFFFQSALTSSVNDPIDLSCSSIRPAKLHSVIPTAQGLILFSAKQQFIMFSDTEILTPQTSVIRAVSNFEMDAKIDPVDIGTSISFVSKTPSYTRVYGASTRGERESPLIHDVGKIVDDWIPNTITELLASSQNSLIALYGNTMRDMYLYKTYQVDQKNLMQAWVKWRLPGEVQFAVIDQDYMYTVVRSGGTRTYDLLQASMSHTPEEVIIVNSDGQRVNPHMDYYSPASSIKYKEVIDISGTWNWMADGFGYRSTPNVTVDVPGGPVPTPGAAATATSTLGTITPGPGTPSQWGDAFYADVDPTNTFVTAVTLTDGGNGYNFSPNIYVGDYWEEDKDYVVGDQVITWYSTAIWTCTIAGKSGNSFVGDTSPMTAVAAGSTPPIPTSFSDKGSSSNTGATWEHQYFIDPRGWYVSNTAGDYYEPATRSLYVHADINQDDFSRVYLPYADIPSLDPIIVIAGSSANWGGGNQSGFTITPERDNDGNPYFKVPREDLSADLDPNDLIVGFKYDYDVTLPKTYYRTDPDMLKSDYTANLTIARMKFAVGLSSVLGFKLKRKGYIGPSVEYIGDSIDGTNGTNSFITSFELEKENGVVVKRDGVKQDEANYTVSKNFDANGVWIDKQYKVTFIPGQVPMGHTIDNLINGPDWDNGWQDETNLPTTTNGNGTGMTVDTTTSHGTIEHISINNQGSGYEANDIVYVEAGHINAFTFTSGGTYNYNGPGGSSPQFGNNPYTVVGDCVAAGLSGTACNQYTTTSVNGTGAEFLVTIKPGGGWIESIDIVNKGTGFVVGDTITISGYDLGWQKYGGGSVDPDDVVLTVTAINNPSQFTVTSQPHNISITTDTWYTVSPSIEAGDYLADDVPLLESNVFTLPIHQRNENFDLKLFSDSPFPVSINSMMWEGQYSPQFYKRS